MYKVCHPEGRRTCSTYKSSAHGTPFLSFLPHSPSSCHRFVRSSLKPWGTMPTDQGKPGEFGDEEKLEDQAVVEQCVDAASITLSVDARAEKALVRRLDLRILPIACLMYLVACESCR